MEWLAAHHPEYVDRLAELVEQGRIEILGGAYFEPILAMIPSRDRIGQIRSYTRWLQNRLGATIRGLWVPERVWEQSFTRDLVDAGIEYTVLDDFHFKCAGLTESQLTGHLLTEDEGRVLSVFPGSERLRYTIPFADRRKQTIDYLAKMADEHPERGGRSSATTARSSAPGRRRRSTSTTTAGWRGSSTPWCRTRTGSR